MSAAPVPEWDDDVMALADAVGVTPATGHPELACEHLPHPAHRHEFRDPALAAMVGNWAHAQAVYDEPIPFELTTAALGYCERCGGTGLVEQRSPFTGSEGTITCPACRGES